MTSPEQKLESPASSLSAIQKKQIITKFKTLIIRKHRMKKLRELVAKKKAQLRASNPSSIIAKDSPFVPCSNNCITTFVKEIQSQCSTNNQLLIDLGCGDARLLIACAKAYPSLKCIGIEIQPKMVAKANQRIQNAGMQEQIEIIQCDFKSETALKILQNATIVFLFLLQNIMPLITDLLMNNLSKGAKVYSYVFDLCFKNTKKVCIDHWCYPQFGGQMKFIPYNYQRREINIDMKCMKAGRIIFTEIHSDLKQYFGCEQNCELIDVHIDYGLKLDEIQTEWDFQQFEYQFHSLFNKYYQQKRCVSDCNEKNNGLHIVLQNNGKEMFVEPTEIYEIVRCFKNGSDMRSDLKMYEFPLGDIHGWKNPNSAFRFSHEK